MDRDTASYLLGEDLMVDCGWWATLGMLKYGADPHRVRHLLLTHCHHDHVMGLPQLLFYKGHGSRGNPSHLDIWGPAEEVKTIVDLAQRFLRHEKHPNAVPQIRIHGLKPGDSVAVGSWNVRTCRSIHPVPGLCFRIESTDGAVIALGGDTAYNRDLIRLARGADLLIHEASYGNEAPQHNPSGHSGGTEAGRVAQEAGVSRLVLVHAPEPRRREAVEAARQYVADTHFATEGERLAFGKS